MKIFKEIKVKPVTSVQEYEIVIDVDHTANMYGRTYENNPTEVMGSLVRSNKVIGIVRLYLKSVSYLNIIHTVVKKWSSYNKIAIYFYPDDIEERDALLQAIGAKEGEVSKVQIGRQQALVIMRNNMKKSGIYQIRITDSKK